MRYVNNEVQDTVQRYSQSDDMEGVSFLSPANGTASGSNGGTPIKSQHKVVTKLTYGGNPTDLDMSSSPHTTPDDRQFNTLPLYKSGVNQPGERDVTSRDGRKGLNSSVQELSHEREQSYSATAAGGPNGNNSGTFL